MDRYQRVERPREESRIDANEVRITAMGRMRNYVAYAAGLLQETMASRLPSDSGSSPTPGTGSETFIERSDTSEFFVPPGSNDPGWKYAFLENPSTPSMVTCRLCRKVVKGGINRMKQHLAHIKGNTSSCPKVSSEVKKEIMDNMEGIKAKKNEKTSRMKEIQGQVSIKINQPLDDEERDGKRLRISAQEVPAETLRQSSIKDTFAKEERARVNTFVAKYFYDNDIAFNVVKSDSFLRMCEAIGQYGRSYKPPTYYELTETLLKEQVKETKDFLQTHRDSWKTSGCSIMTDAWTDRRGRSIMNICVNCVLGTSFLNSIDSSADSHIAEYIASLVDKSIEEVGPDNVVQVVTDNASANMAAGRILRAKYPRIFWSSCAAHCIDLMLEEIGKESKVKTAITKARTLSVFIYSHAKTLSLMRQFTQKGEIVRPGTTRFATTYLTLQSVMEKKDKLRLMFSSDEWRACKWYKTKKGEMTSAIVLSPSFWTQVSLTLKVFSPLVHVLRIVDGDRRPAMGFVYGELQDARKEIMGIFKDVEASYKHFVDAIDSKAKGRLDSPLHLAAYYLNPYFFYRDIAQIQREGLALKGFLDCMDIFYPDLEIQDIITRKELPLYEGAEGSFGKPLAIRQRSIIDDDFNPARWWELHGMETPQLKEMAMKILRLTASSSGCERNWSTFEAETSSNEIVFKAMGRAINKAVMIVELIKRRIVGLHQITSIGSIDIIDTWEPLEEGLLPLETTRHVSVITIILAKKQPDTSSVGYQCPLPSDQVKQWTEFDHEGEAGVRGGRGRSRGGRGRAKAKGNGNLVDEIGDGGCDDQGHGYVRNHGRGRGSRGQSMGGGYGVRGDYQNEADGNNGITGEYGGKDYQHEAGGGHALEGDDGQHDDQHEVHGSFAPPRGRGRGRGQGHGHGRRSFRANGLVQGVA